MHCTENLLEKVKSESDQKKLTFNITKEVFRRRNTILNILNITHYPFFKMLETLQELKVLLISDQEHKNASQDITFVVFHNGKILKDHLVRAKLPNFKITGRSESWGKGNCQVCDFICDTGTFTTKACGETFKIQTGRLHGNSQKVVHILNCRICGKPPFVGKAKAKFRARFNDYKSAHRSYRK